MPDPVANSNNFHSRTLQVTSQPTLAYHYRKQRVSHAAYTARIHHGETRLRLLWWVSTNVPGRRQFRDVAASGDLPMSIIEA